jgi:Uma2 family endonuclease
MSLSKTTFSLQEFLAMPESSDRTELVNGEIVSKVSPKYKHSTLQLRLLLALNQWCESSGSGRVRPGWAVVLKRQGQDWVPVPDLTCVSYDRLSADWEEDLPSPVLPQLVIEIISLGQSFGEMTCKATDYLLAGVDRVWIVDNQAPSVTVFGNQDALEHTPLLQG